MRDDILILPPSEIDLSQVHGLNPTPQPTGFPVDELKAALIGILQDQTDTFQTAFKLQNQEFDNKVDALVANINVTLNDFDGRLTEVERLVAAQGEQQFYLEQVLDSFMKRVLLEGTMSDEALEKHNAVIKLFLRNNATSQADQSAEQALTH
jgi:hypothetical protein